MDLLRGALLIGGVPLIAYGLLLLTGNLAVWLRIEVAERFADAAVGSATVAALGGFGWALWHRSRRRAIPIGFIVLEAVFGLVGAFTVVLFRELMKRSVNQ